MLKKRGGEVSNYLGLFTKARVFGGYAPEFTVCFGIFRFKLGKNIKSGSF